MVKKQKVYFLKGLPGSGKSTWAKKFQEEQARRGKVIKRINKDDLRSMLDNSVHSKEREKFILEVRNSLIRTCLINGYDVLIDDTNFHPRHEETIRNIIDNEFKNVELELVDFSDVPLQTCIQRDAIRENSVGRAVIMDMYNRYLKQTPKQIIPDSSLPNCIVIDVDGTLALHETRKAFDYWKAGEDRLNYPVADLVKRIQETANFLHTIVVTGRENLCNEDGWTISDVTQGWLREKDVHFDDIYIRKQGDHRPDYEVKKEIYENHIKGKYNVLYVIDDRKQVIDMWRAEGLTVLDVAGNEF